MDPSRVTSREDLIAFLEALSHEYVEHPETWENADLTAFLEALGAWVQDSPGYFANRGEPVPEQPTWALIATMLRAAARYE